MSSGYRQKLQSALAVASEAGISGSFPPLLRSLSKLGLPVRPLHFMSVPGLVLFLTLGLSAVILGFHWLAISMDVASRPVRMLQNLGVSGSIAFGVFAGILTAIVIRYQALRADLPAWRDL
ncbi:MAG TPA: DUF6404 family protein [Tabrizicola sp.]|nr:DUF6404 family protein [Tabrizicola sp.]